jgi:DNA helicase-2/ATP-dependent DNA helicase PcrA
MPDAAGKDGSFACPVEIISFSNICFPRQKQTLLMTDLYDGLNDAQYAAITAPAAPVLVLAGPGSGKTRVLTHRIAYLIMELKVRPWQIMAVTFTNKAAKEMRQRVDDLLGGQAEGLAMGTFHATCARILRRETDNLTHYGRDFVIFDTADQQQVIKQALKDLNLDDKKFPPNKLLNAISNAKNELITPQMYASTNYIAEVTRRVYEQYQLLLQANNAMDFDDLLMNTVLLFDERPDILQGYQNKYEHILVDEFQDTNTTQYALLRMLAAGHHNLFVVGDSDQSIYKWRGADFRNIERFREQYPEAQQILLEQNYRSTQIILDVAKAVIKRNPNRVHKELFTIRQGGMPVSVREAYNEQEEAEFVLDTISKLAREGYSTGDVAVMYRTNAQSRVLEEYFLRMGLPYRVVGATEFYKRREVKDVIAYLRVVHNPADAVSFNRVLNAPTRGIGAKTRQSLLDWAAGQNMQPAEALVALAQDANVPHPFNGRALNALTDFGLMLNTWIALADKVTVADLLDVILEQIDYRAFLDDGTAEGDERWENVLEFRNAASQAEESTLAEFLEQVALVSETDNLEDSASAATLLTLHAAKGLEFPVVFLTGLEDGLLPHSRSLDDAEELAEERRLFYVGITRAKDRVYMSHAFRRTFYGDSSVSVPSRFLNDIPPEFMEGQDTAVRRQNSKMRAGSWNDGSSFDGEEARANRGRRGATSTRWDSKPAQPSTGTRRDKSLPTPRAELPEATREPSPAAATPQFQTGQRVRHARFGEGTVIESKWTGNDEEVTVAFPGEGIKRLVASFAKLEILP